MILTDSISLQHIKDGKPIESTTFVDCANLDLTSIGDLSTLKNLRKINLKNNKIECIKNLKSVRDLLTWVNLDSNLLSSIVGFQDFKKLLVLNLNKNKIKQITNDFSTLSSLKALILSNNQITKIQNLNTLSSLTSLILSHNNIDSAGLHGLPVLPCLTKLSISHNKLTSLAIKGSSLDILLPVLKELRLNDNEISRIDNIPFPKSLDILDLGNNKIMEIARIVPESGMENSVTQSLLVNLNVKGNPFLEEGEKDSADMKESVLEIFQNLRVLNGERFDEKFLVRQKKIKEDRAKFAAERDSRKVFQAIRLRRKEEGVDNKDKKKKSKDSKKAGERDDVEETQKKVVERKVTDGASKKGSKETKEVDMDIVEDNDKRKSISNGSKTEPVVLKASKMKRKAGDEVDTGQKPKKLAKKNEKTPDSKTKRSKPSKSTESKEPKIQIQSNDVAKETLVVREKNFINPTATSHTGLVKVVEVKNKKKVAIPFDPSSLMLNDVVVNKWD